MKTFFIFFSICIVSAFSSTPWLNEDSKDLGISGHIAFEDAPVSNETEDHQGHGASFSTTAKTTTLTTTRPISILNKEIIDAVEAGNDATVRKLLNEGADVNVRKIGEYRNNTILHIATDNGHENVVSLLLAHGANANDKNKPLGDAAIHKASESGYANIVSLLLAYNVSVEMKGENNQTPLHNAAECGHVNVASLLLDKGANTEAKRRSNTTPLHVAARYGHTNVVSLLLDKGANIEAQDNTAWTPLHYASLCDHVNVVSLLLDKGANIEARTTDNWTPLHYAAWSRDVNVVSLLLDKGANIEARSTSHWTPLHSAVVYGNVNVVSLLLDKGANIFAKGYWLGADSTPLDLAKRQRNRRPEILEILERKQRHLITG